jgi:hypothetical protein
MGNFWDLALNPNAQQFGPEDLLVQAPQRGPASFRPAPPAPVQEVEPERSPASARRKPSSSKFQSVLDEQEAGVGNLEDLARQYAEMAEANKGRMNLSPLMQLSDSLFGSNIAKGYDAPETEEEVMGKKAAFQKEINAARTPIAQELLKQYASENSAEGKYWSQAMKRMGDGDKAFEKAMDDILMKGRQSVTIKQAQEKLGRVNSAMGLIEAIESNPNLVEQGKYNPADMNELTASVAATINNTSVTTDSMRKSLEVANAPLSAAGIVQWFNAKPHGVEQQEWINRFVRTLDAEYEQVDRKVGAHYRGVLARAARRVSPEEMEILKQESEAFRREAYRKPSVVYEEAKNKGAEARGVKEVRLRDKKTGETSRVNVKDWESASPEEKAEFEVMK